MRATTASKPAAARTAFARLGNDYIFERSADDIENILGGDGDDYICTSGGTDRTIFGGAGNDVIRGGPQNPIREGADQLGDGVSDGGAGNDIVLGGGAADIVKGGDGNDILYGGAMVDRLDCGAGTDLAVVESALEGQIAASLGCERDRHRRPLGERRELRRALRHAAPRQGDGRRGLAARGSRVRGGAALRAPDDVVERAQAQRHAVARGALAAPSPVVEHRLRRGDLVGQLDDDRAPLQRRVRRHHLTVAGIAQVRAELALEAVALRAVGRPRAGLDDRQQRVAVGVLGDDVDLVGFLDARHGASVRHARAVYRAAMKRKLLAGIVVAAAVGAAASVHRMIKPVPS